MIDTKIIMGIYIIPFILFLLIPLTISFSALFDDNKTFKNTFIEICKYLFNSDLGSTMFYILVVIIPSLILLLISI